MKIEQKTYEQITKEAGFTLNQVSPEYIERLIEQADILQALIEIENEKLSIEMKSTCNYLIGYIHALKK